MATDAQTLISSVSCYECLAPGQWQLLKLALLKQILLNLNPMADTSAQGLMNQAACYECYGMGGMWQLFELALLAQISTNGSTGGGGISCANYGGGQPNFTPTTACAIAIDTSNGRQWQYYNGAWQ